MSTFPFSMLLLFSPQKRCAGDIIRKMKIANPTWVTPLANHLQIVDYPVCANDCTNAIHWAAANIPTRFGQQNVYVHKIYQRSVRTIRSKRCICALLTVIASMHRKLVVNSSKRSSETSMKCNRGSKPTCIDLSEELAMGNKSKS